MVKRNTDTDERMLTSGACGKTLGELYDTHYEMMLRYCMRRLFIREVAEDVTSEVFLRVARNIHSFRGTALADFRRWVYTIATNEISSHIRKTRRREALLAAAVETGKIASREAAAPDHDWPAVFRAIMKLKDKDQILIALRFFENMNTAEIAEVIGLKNGAVRTRLSRATDRLRKILRNLR